MVIRTVLVNSVCCLVLWRLQNNSAGEIKFYTDKRGQGKKSFSHTEGGHIRL